MKEGRTKRGCRSEGKEANEDSEKKGRTHRSVLAQKKGSGRGVGGGCGGRRRKEGVKQGRIES
jgi:hypothetical protein